MISRIKVLSLPDEIDLKSIYALMKANLDLSDENILNIALLLMYQLTNKIDYAIKAGINVFC